MKTLGKILILTYSLSGFAQEFPMSWNNTLMLKSSKCSDLENLVTNINKDLPEESKLELWCEPLGKKSNKNDFIKALLMSKKSLCVSPDYIENQAISIGDYYRIPSPFFSTSTVHWEFLPLMRRHGFRLNGVGGSRVNFTSVNPPSCVSRNLYKTDIKKLEDQSILGRYNGVNQDDQPCSVNLSEKGAIRENGVAFHYLVADIETGLKDKKLSHFRFVIDQNQITHGKDGIALANNFQVDRENPGQWKLKQYLELDFSQQTKLDKLEIRQEYETISWDRYITVKNETFCRDLTLQK